VPQNIPSYNFRIRFRDVGDTETLAEISGLTMMGVEIISPNGDEEWLVGSSQTIMWTVIDAYGADYVDLYFSSTNWVDSTPIASSQYEGSFGWTVPNSPSTDVRIRAYGTELWLMDETDAPFTIAGFKVTYPNGGETFEVGSNEEIKWETTGSIEAVDIWIQPEGWMTIAEGIPNTGSYPWVVEDYAGLEGRLRVTQASNTACNDVSDSWFSIAKLTVTSPNGGEVLYGGSTHLINWTSYGWEGSFLVELSTDAGGIWTPLNPSVSSTSWNWPVPESWEYTQCLIRVTSSDGAVSDVSDNFFTITQGVAPE